MPWCVVVEPNEQAHAATRGVNLRERMELLIQLPVTVGKLTVGDYALDWIDDDGTQRTVALLERKAMPDMLASIHDGRYVSQAARLVASGVPHAFWVVVDGVLPRPEDHRAVDSAVAHLASPAYPNITPVCVRDSDAAFCALIASLAKYTHDALHCGNQLSEAPLHTVVQEAGARVKLDTQEVVWREQLAVPRGMSLRTARAVSAAYPTATSLLRAYRRCVVRHRAQPPPAPTKGRKRPPPTLEAELDGMLADIVVPGAGRLGPARSAMLRRVIVPDPTELDAVAP